MAGDRDRHEDGPSAARRVGRGAAAAVGGAALSLPVAASAMAMPVCACGSTHAPPAPDPPEPAPPHRLSVEDQEAIKKESAPPPPQQAAPPPVVHPSPDAMDANQAAAERNKPVYGPPVPKNLPPEDRAAFKKDSAPPPPQQAAPPPVHPSPDAMDANRAAEERNKPVYGPPAPQPQPEPGPPPQPAKVAPPPPPPDKPVYGPPLPKNLPPEDREAIKRESAPPPPQPRIPSIVEKQPPAPPPSPNLFSLLDPLAALRGAPSPPKHDAYPTKGPALADAPHDQIGGVPFVGSVETELGCSYGVGGAKCLHLPTGEESKPGPSASVEITHTEVKKRGGEELGEDGRKVSLEVSGDWKVSEKVGLETKKQLEVELERSVSRGVSYEATIAPKRAEAISNGDAAPPNPIDPGSLQKGDGVVFSHEQTKGGSEKVTYKLVSLGDSHETGKRESTGVTRVDDKTVRVYVGNEDLVRNALELGIGIDELGASIGNSLELDDGKVRQVDIDTSTKEGQQAYRRFIGSGSLPEAKTDGVTDTAVADTARWSSSSTFSMHVGPMKLGGTSQGSRGVSTEVRHADGTVEQSFTTDEGDVGAINKTVNKVGTPTQTSYALLLQNVNKWSADGYRQLHGAHSHINGNRDLRIDFTDTELVQMRDQAVDQLVDYTKHMGEHLTRDEVKQRLEDHQPVSSSIETEMVAGAKTPEQVLGALDLIARGNSTKATEFLETFTLATARAHQRPPKALGTLTVTDPAR